MITLTATITTAMTSMTSNTAEPKPENSGTVGVGEAETVGVDEGKMVGEVEGLGDAVGAVEGVGVKVGEGVGLVTVICVMLLPPEPSISNPSGPIITSRGSGCELLGKSVPLTR